MNKNELMNLYENLKIVITDEDERRNFKILCEKAIEERTHDDMYFFASIFYAYGKVAAKQKEREMKRNGEFKAIQN